MDRELRHKAVDRAYREHAQDVYRVAYAILRESDAAIDATHDTFARAFERWEQYDANRSLRGWLHGIVTHAALDALRRRRVRQLALPALGRVGELDLVASGRGGDPSVEVIRRRIVDESLAGLRPDARAAIVLRHYYGYDYAEIAGFLRTSPGNVGSILSRAHGVLRERLSAEGPAATLSSEAAGPNVVSSERGTPGRATNGR
jgi:RNA polymerase sigma-70 factor (ECF subfamily)